ncbi:MAG: helix-turn-helix transcriptional regulator [Clostridia bacterium]|nr:helix-turn-helix transcriptional regulator [Clostridia bacterium]
MITLQQIHEQIKNAIKYSGLSQTEIAAKLGVKQPTVSEYVSGRSFPALDTLANLCKVLDLDANEILCLK